MDRGKYTKQGRILYRKTSPGIERAIQASEWTEFDLISGWVFDHHEVADNADPDQQQVLLDSIVDLQ